MEVERKFSEIYSFYYPRLCRFATEYVGNVEDAENLVQDTFVYLWNNSASLDTVVNLNAFLFVLIKNRSIDFLRQQLRKGRTAYCLLETMEYELNLEALEAVDETLILDSDLEQKIHEAIQSLPGKCREIFILSRVEGLKYTEIAEKLHLSTSTVDNQIGIALKKLRVKLKDFLPLLVFLL